MTVTLAPPPDPTGLNTFPDTPEMTLIDTKKLDDMETEKKLAGHWLKYTEKMTNRVVKYYEGWYKVCAGTATPTMPFTETLSVTTGVTNSKTEETVFSLSLTGTLNLLSIGPSLSKYFTKTFTFSDSKTTSRTFSIMPHKDETTGIWWQKYQYFLLEYDLEVVAKHHSHSSKLPHSGPQSKNLHNLLSTFVASQYPEPAASAESKENTDGKS